jgi:hypothetical protein
VCNLVDGAGYPMRPQPGAAWVVYAPPGTQVSTS